jgi:hypothetical protein
MDVAAYACLVRFQAFPFIPDDLKRRPIRYLFEMDVQHPAFQKIIVPFFTNNQFTAFCRFLTMVKKRNWMRFPRCDRDYDVIEALFWEETTEPLAKRILATLLTFPHHTHDLIWKSAMNLLLQATCAEEKEAALCLLEAFLCTTA